MSLTAVLSILTAGKFRVSWLLLDDLREWSVGFDHRGLHLVDESVGRFNVGLGDHCAIRSVPSGTVGAAEKIQPEKKKKERNSNTIRGLIGGLTSH